MAGGCLWAALAGLAAGCAQPKTGEVATANPPLDQQIQYRMIGVADNAAPPEESSRAKAAPAGEEAAASAAEYVLQPGDEINIKIYQEPELSGLFKLDPEGEIRHPLLGTVP